MEVPHQYPYNPPVSLIFLSFGGGVLWIAVDWLPPGHIPTGFKLGFSHRVVIDFCCAPDLG
jgi:hypothetical protein